MALLNSRGAHCPFTRQACIDSIQEVKMASENWVQKIGCEPACVMVLPFTVVPLTAEVTCPSTTCTNSEGPLLANGTCI